MPEKKRTFEAEAHSAKSLKLQPRPAGDENRQPLPFSPLEKREFPFSREVILRLIDWLKKV